MSDLLAQLNPQQQEAVSHARGPLLVVAGAGSGKTRVITHRIAHLITERQVPHYAILAITFTNKAAREMKSRVADLLEGALLPEEIAEMWVSTFHSACTRILHRNHELLGYPERFSIYDASDSTRTVKTVMDELGLDTKRLTPKFFRDQISRAKNDLLTPEQMLEQAEEREIYYPQETFETFRRYQQVLKDCGAMDFDDLLVQTDLLLAQNPEVLSYYQRKFRHTLIDEYQDTNAVQNSIALRLCRAQTGGSELFAVGDADQSIYRFRGARIGNIAQLQKALPDIKTVLLEENYRSTENILRSANNVIGFNPRRFDRTLRPHRRPTPADQKVTISATRDDRHESYWVADKIRELMDADPALEWGDFAVLYRTNAQSAQLEQTFARQDIPFQVVGGIGFFDRKEIKDAMAFLRAVINPRDVQSITRIVNYPPRGIGPGTVRKLVDFAALEDIPLGEALRRCGEAGVSAKARVGIGRFLELCQAAEAEMHHGPEHVLELLLTQSRYLPRLHEQMAKELADLPVSPAAGQIENLQRLLTMARDYETVADFVDYTSLLTSVDETLESILEGEGGGHGSSGGSGTFSDSKVSLMTVHAAKGLEFGVVFVVGMEDGIFPHRNSTEDPDDLEEERRLAYVAITRAKEQLYLTYADMRKQYQEVLTNAPSRFLQELAGRIAGDNNEFVQFLEPDSSDGWGSGGRGSGGRGSGGRGSGADISDGLDDFDSSDGFDFSDVEWGDSETEAGFGTRRTGSFGARQGGGRGARSGFGPGARRTGGYSARRTGSPGARSSGRGAKAGADKSTSPSAFSAWFNGSGASAGANSGAGNSNSGANSAAADSEADAGQADDPAADPTVDPTASTEPYCIDDEIEHKRWGKGVVLDVKGAGNSEEIVVKFHQAGLKHLLVSAAPISKVSPD